MNPYDHLLAQQTRRYFLGSMSGGLGAIALQNVLGPTAMADNRNPLSPRVPHFAAKAKRVIYLHMTGSPPNLDLFDYKPTMNAYFDKELPDSIRMGQRITTMTSGQKRFPVAPSMFRFRQHGQSGAWLSELLPYTAAMADDICFVKTVVTEAINHDPAITYFQTGSQIAGRPSMGAWISYGLGSENSDLPAFVAMTSLGTGNKNDQPLYDRLWGSGFLPTTHQGVKFRSADDPVLYLKNPPGVTASIKRTMLDDVMQLNRQRLDIVGDPEIATRIAQYELAFRMQSSIPELADFSSEPQHVLDMYGTKGGDGSFAANCLLARRLAERT